MRPQKLARTALKTAVSLALLIWLAFTISKSGDALPSWQALRLDWLGIVLALHALAVCVGTLRWWVLLRGQDLSLGAGLVGYWICLRAFLVGRFFGAFTPSTIGLDGYRLAESGRITGNLPGATSVIFAEKVAGLSGMSLVSLASLFWFRRNTEGPNPETMAAGNVSMIHTLAWLVLPAVLVLGTVLLRKPSLITQPLLTLAGQYPKQSFWRAFAHRVAAMEAKIVPLSWWSLVVATLLGAITHLALATTFAAAGRTLSIEVSFLAMVGCGNLIQLGVLAPISLGGIGVREGVATIAFSSLGVSASAAAALALLSYLIGQLPALVGGVLHLLSTKPKPKKENPAEAG